VHAIESSFDDQVKDIRPNNLRSLSAVSGTHVSMVLNFVQHSVNHGCTMYSHNLHTV